MMMGVPRQIEEEAAAEQVDAIPGVPGLDRRTLGAHQTIVLNVIDRFEEKFRIRGAREKKGDATPARRQKKQHNDRQGHRQAGEKPVTGRPERPPRLSQSFLLDLERAAQLPEQQAKN